MEKIKLSKLVAVVLSAGLLLFSLDPVFGADVSTQVNQPVGQEVCFSPGENCDEKLLLFVRSARKMIDVAIYDITLESLVNELILKGKSIPVRVIVDERQSKGSRSRVLQLANQGAAIRFGRQSGFFHNKFTIVDGKKVETGSFNYTERATHLNSENQVYLETPEVVTAYQKHFEDLWKNGRPVSKRQ
ncbi:phospholipase D-like domain-containing protein [Bdellovibrionota bacterium FG-2]